MVWYSVTTYVEGATRVAVRDAESLEDFISKGMSR